MAYIGRGVDNISNVEKLDNITFSGSTATFNLTKGGSAFTPSSAECIRLAIDGIEQGNNYTVSGSQITFDFTPSGSSTNNWIYHIGVGVITTPADGSVTEAKIGSSAVTTAKINDGAVTSGKIASGVIPDAVTLRPNAKPLIINGNMALAQRGTSFSQPNTNNNAFPVDRFTFQTGSIGAYTSTQETLTSGNAYNSGFRNASRIDCTTADASPSSGDYFWFQYTMEAQDCLVFKKGTSNAEKMTVAFWVKSNKTGTGQLTVKDSDNDRQVAGTYTISSANTWEHKVINLPADTTGAINNDNGAGFRFEWWLGGGSSYTSGSVPTTWEARVDADRGVQNLAINDSTSNDWSITGIQVEVGESTVSWCVGVVLVCVDWMRDLKCVLLKRKL